MSTLQEDLVYGPEPRTEEQRAAFRIDTDAKATWALRKLRHSRQRRTEIRAQAEQEIAAIEAWLAREEGPLDREDRWVTLLLEDYARAQRTQGRKSIDTPAGQIATRKTGGGLVIEDTVLLDWLRTNHPGWITTETVERRPTVADLKAALDVGTGIVVDPSTAEIVPGITVAPAGVGVTIKPSE